MGGTITALIASFKTCIKENNILTHLLTIGVQEFKKTTVCLSVIGGGRNDETFRSYFGRDTRIRGCGRGDGNFHGGYPLLLVGLCFRMRQDMGFKLVDWANFLEQPSNGQTYGRSPV